MNREKEALLIADDGNRWDDWKRESRGVLLMDSKNKKVVPLGLDWIGLGLLTTEKSCLNLRKWKQIVQTPVNLPTR